MLRVRGPCTIAGRIRAPGDKSISHRALMLAAVGRGDTTLRNMAPGEDVASTVACLESFGVSIVEQDGVVTVDGRGMHSWAPPSAPLDCGNSGTTMRLLAGFAAHYAFASVFDGDQSLRRRPMTRIVGPLQALGARVETSDGRPPVVVEGGRLRGCAIDTEIPSAQIKSCALFAAMGAEGHTTVVESRPSRDHTERLLAALGAPVTESFEEDGRHRIGLVQYQPPAFDLDVPGDVSSAAFVSAAAALAGEVRVEGVGLNPTRIAFLQALQRMGAKVGTAQEETRLGEPVGYIDVQRSDLGAVEIDGGDPRLQDELPLLAVLATQATGRTSVRGAAELRVKESDRIAALVEGLRRLGADVEELRDGFEVNGPTPLSGNAVAAAGDHRIAMAFAVAGLVAKGDTDVDGFECAAVSWPGFSEVLASLGAEVQLR